CLLSDLKLSDHERFAQTQARGIRALSGHIESTDVTNDVNGGPSGVGIAAAAGKAAFWDIVGAPVGSPKVIAFEGEFAMCAGHAQELKTQAVALQVGKRLRIFFSDNNAGIDDALLGGVVQQVRRLSADGSVDVLWMERVVHPRWSRLRSNPRRVEDDGELGSERSSSD